MILLAPWALWFLALGGGVVALYLLKIKRRQAVVPALDFWLALAGRTKVHSLWERLKRILSMLLWLVIVACLVLALSNPIFSLGKTKPRAIAIVLDNSASMLTSEDGEQKTTRFELAKKALHELTTTRPVTDQWLLIEAAREPRVVRPWTLDAKSVRRAADELRPFAGAADLAGAVALAGQLLEGKPDPCIVVISDGAAGGVATLAANDTRIVHWPVGKATDNLGIARLAVRPHRRQGNYHALLSIVNASDEKVETQAVLELDGSTHSVELVSVEPHAVWEKTVVIEPPQGFAGSVLRVSIDRPDALAQDNEAYAALEPIRPAVVWLVSKPDSAFFFEQALASMDTLVLPEESLTLTPEQYERALAAVTPARARSPTAPTPTSPSPGEAASPTGTLRAPDLIIFNGWTPPTLPASGRFVLINAWSTDLPVTVREALEAPRLYLPPKPHPLTQHVTFQGARLARAQRVTLNQPATVLAHSAEGDPLIVLFDQPDRQVLCLAFDVLDSDLPFRNAFPLLLRNAVAYLHDEGPSWLRPEYKIGEPIHASRALPASVTGVPAKIVRGGKSTDSTLPVQESRFVFTDTESAGAVRFTIGDETSIAAINLADADESRIGVSIPEENPVKVLSLSGRLFGTLPWIGLVLIAGAFITLEWLTFHYRWTE
jgi:hypothetical protein